MASNGQVACFEIINDAYDNPGEWIKVLLVDSDQQPVTMAVRCHTRSPKDGRHLFYYYVKVGVYADLDTSQETSGDPTAYKTRWCGPLNHQYETIERVLRLFDVDLTWARDCA